MWVSPGFSLTVQATDTLCLGFRGGSQRFGGSKEGSGFGARSGIAEECDPDAIESTSHSAPLQVKAGGGEDSCFDPGQWKYQKVGYVLGRMLGAK